MSTSNQTRELVFIINPKAGFPGNNPLERWIGKHLDSSKYRYQLRYTEYAGHARELASEAVSLDVSMVVAVGGDGTMNECAGALVGSSTALGLIPLGSGNGLARDLGIPSHPQKAVQMLNNHQTKYLDCGVINQWKFFCTAGVGFDAYVSEKFENQQIRGFLGYIRTSLLAYINYQSKDFSIKTEEQPFKQKAFSVTLANACQFGNNAIIAPDADPSDGYLELCIVRDFPKQIGLPMVIRLFSGTINRSRYVQTRRIKEALIDCPEGSNIHLDGDVRKLDRNKLEVKIIPNAVQVAVP